MNFNYTLHASQIGAFNAGIENQVKADHLIIFEAFVKFSGSINCPKRNDKGKIYFQFGWKFVADKLPLLGLNSRTPIKNRIKDLCDSGLLFAHPDNQKSGRPWYAWGPKYDAYWSGNPVKIITKKPVPNQDTPSLSEDTPVLNEGRQPVPIGGRISTYSSTNNNQQEAKLQLTPFEITLVEVEKELGPDRYKLFLKFLAYRRRRKKPLRDSESILAQMKSKWLPYSFETLSLAYEETIAEGWAGIFPKKHILKVNPLKHEELKIFQNCEAYLKYRFKATFNLDFSLSDSDAKYLRGKVEKGLTGISLYHLINQAAQDRLSDEKLKLNYLLGLYLSNQKSIKNALADGTKLVKWKGMK